MSQVDDLPSLAPASPDEHEAAGGFVRQGAKYNARWKRI